MHGTTKIKKKMPATCPYPVPDESSQCHFLICSYAYPPIYTQVFQVVSFPQVSLPKPCMHLSFSHARATNPASLYSGCDLPE